MSASTISKAACSCAASGPARCRWRTSSASTANPPWPKSSKRRCAKPIPRSSPITVSSSRSSPRWCCPRKRARSTSVIEGKSDLAYTVEMEIVPPITLADFKTIKLTRLTAEVTDEEIDQALQTIADQNRPFVAKAEGAANGDRVTIGFEGSIEGNAVRRRHRRGCAARASARANSFRASRSTSSGSRPATARPSTSNFPTTIGPPRLAGKTRPSPSP